MPFSLKNAGATFQRAMTLIFHDLKTIIEVYLGDLASHSHLRVFHPYHLRLVFERCHHYQFRFNHHTVHILHESWSFTRIHHIQGGY